MPLGHIRKVPRHDATQRGDEAALLIGFEQWRLAGRARRSMVRQLQHVAGQRHTRRQRHRDVERSSHTVVSVSRAHEGRIV